MGTRMRALWMSLAASVMMSAPALAGGIETMPGHLVSYATVDVGGGVPTVNRGDQFDVACDSISAASADVRVVMALGGNDGAATGYSAVLATNQTVARHAVHVQVPDVPDLANRTVNVKVYVTDARGTKACDAGRVHIG
jgi:hypothetical protein